MNNHQLDLRKKTDPLVVERVVFSKSPWRIELAKVILGVLVATGAVFAISKADEVSSILIGENPTKSFSAIGFVMSVSEDSLLIEKASGSDGRKDAQYTFSIASISKVETSDYVPLALSSLQVGDQIIVQGTETGGVITPTRVVSFSSVRAADAVAVDDSSVATSSVATSTLSEGVTVPDEILASSTPSDSLVIEFATSTGTSTPVDAGLATTSDPIVASTSPEVIIDSSASSTPEVSVESSATSSTDAQLPVAEQADPSPEPTPAPEPAPEVAPEETPAPEPAQESVPAE